MATPVLSPIPSSNARGDLVALAIFTIVGLVLAGSIDLFEQAMEFAETHEDWELDKVFTAAWLMTIGGAVYAYRRAVAFCALTKRRRSEPSSWLSMTR